MNRRHFLKTTAVSAVSASAMAGSLALGQQQLSNGTGTRPADRARGGGGLRLSIALSSNPRTWPLIDGTVRPDGVDLVASVLHPSEMFYRQLKFAEFDISEMSMSSFMMARAHGDDRFIGIPVFTTHHFFHTWPLVRRAAKIARPQDLKGKRVGVPEYQQTAALWARGALQDEWGVSPRDLHWFMERNPAESHGHATGFAAPPGVEIEQIPYGKSIGSMMVSGELDATLLYIVDANLVDRSTIDLFHHPAVTTLFADPVAEGVRYYRKTGLYPINHGLVIRREVAEQESWVVLNVLKAFDRANELADEQRRAHVESYLETGLLPAASKEALEKPLNAHGIKANRAILEAAARYSEEQGLTPRRVKLEELFAASTLDR
jgi:4,5-dihydroxyphthalate decarboxylase